MMVTMNRDVALIHTIGFPGNIAGGISLVLAPVLLLAGSLLRCRYPFFFISQLAAYAEQPSLIIAAYSCFVAGNVLMCPAILCLVQYIGIKCPTWAILGGLLVIFGLFTRTFHGGIDHLAFQLVTVQNLEMATKAVADSYSAFHIMRYFNLTILLGWVILAIGSYRSGVFGWVRAIALGSMALLPLGTLKGTKIESVIVTAALCMTLVPFGIKLLRETAGKVSEWPFLLKKKNPK